jgi:hypothetical protein
MPLGEWATTVERDAELTEFVKAVRLHAARARKRQKTARVARGKTSSKSVSGAHSSRKKRRKQLGSKRSSK